MLFFACLTGLIGVQAPQPDLRWSPKVNDRLTYEYSLEAVGASPMSVTAYLDIAVTQAGPDGFTTRTVSRGALISMAGSEIRDNRPNPVTARYGAQGNLLEILEGTKDRGAYELGRATKFIAPGAAVKQGDTWTHSFSSDTELGVRTSLWAGKFEGVTATAQGQRAKVSFSVTDGEKKKEAFSAKGVWMVDIATGIPESLSAELQQLGGLKEGGSFKFKLTRYRERGG